MYPDTPADTPRAMANISDVETSGGASSSEEESEGRDEGEEQDLLDFVSKLPTKHPIKNVIEITNPVAGLFIIHSKPLKNSLIPAGIIKAAIATPAKITKM